MTANKFCHFCAESRCQELWRANGWTIDFPSPREEVDGIKWYYMHRLGRGSTESYAFLCSDHAYSQSILQLLPLLKLPIDEEMVVTKKKKKHRNFIAVAAHFRNGGKMDSRPKRLRTRLASKSRAIRDQQ